MEATLYLCVDKSVPGLYEAYQKHVEEHNYKISTDEFPDSGFDLLVPESQSILHNPLTSYFIDFKIKTEMTFKMVENSPELPSAFQIYLRSSISKTPLMLSNHVGVIDSGYRGNIKGAFRCLNVDQYYVQKFQKIVQICHPLLCKINVVLLNDESKLTISNRGEGGFGSTGK
jgi:dUTP pyrophosphatase